MYFVVVEMVIVVFVVGMEVRMGGYGSVFFVGYEVLDMVGM